MKNNEKIAVTKRFCLFTFDIEEWFQVENFKLVMPQKNWELKESSVVKNTSNLLAILEKHDVKGTFFVLGWIARKFPELVNLIIQNGHEVASHGYKHDLVHTSDHTIIRDDIQKSKMILEDISGKEIIGYRAPSFSVNDTLIKILPEIGFKYDSSYNPFRLNARYGSITLPMKEYKRIYQFESGLWEIPASTLKIGKYTLPIAGGAYFRLLPYPLFRQLVQISLKKEGLYTFYLHPWELEPEQPRVKNIPFNYRIRHYTGLKDTAKYLNKLILSLKENECEFCTIESYIKK